MRPTSAALLALTLTAAVAAQGRTAPPAVPGPQVQLAILLDTSGSMNGLINQARTHLWNVVEQLAGARHDSRPVALQVAVYQYGNSGLSADTGYIQQLTPFTDDLDEVSRVLFALTTNGGSEHCPQVVDRSLADLNWSDAAAVYKAVFIAGNETFRQGPIDFAAVAPKAQAKKVFVNTVYCGTDSQQESWAEAAALAGGKASVIDQNATRKDYDTPYDDELKKLNDRLNATFLFYGEQGKWMAANQVAQDANAAGVSNQAQRSRAAAKASGLYKPKQDLVTEAAAKELDLAEVKDEDLPEEVREVAPAERARYLNKKQAERVEVQQQLKDVIARRDSYVANKRREEARQTEATTWGDAMRRILAEQLAQRGFSMAADG